jgi:hypothetical protein
MALLFVVQVSNAQTRDLNDSAKQLLTLDQYNYEKMLDIDISLLSNEVVVRLVFDRTNEIRQNH